MTGARAPSTPPELPGYTVQRLIGLGGFADVFLYRQHLPARDVAVKVLLAPTLDDDVRARFVTEANLMAQLSHHPAIVTVHHAGFAKDGRPYLVMEYCSQPGLAERYRVVRYDQRGAGLSEKVRKQFSNDDAVNDLEDVLKNLDVKPPYNFVCVAAASTQVLRFLERHPEQVQSIVLCNPAPGVDPSRAGALNERADLAERDGIRGVMGITLDKSYPPELGERSAYEACVPTKAGRWGR